MAKIREITDQAGWDSWVASRPAVIQELCALLPPDRLYWLKGLGRRVTLFSYNEDGTVTVDVPGQFNGSTSDHRVFGIKPDDLEECELPVIGSNEIYYMDVYGKRRKVEFAETDPVGTVKPMPLAAGMLEDATVVFDAYFADKPDIFGNTHSAESLRKLADGKNYLYDEERKVLLGLKKLSDVEISSDWYRAASCEED